MHPAIIAVIVFAVALAAVAFLMRKSTLDHVTYAPGEAVLREYRGLTVESGSIGPRRALFPNCRVIVTDRRIIIAQKMLFVERYQVRYILHLGEGAEASSLAKGVVHNGLFRERVRPVREGKRAFLRVVPEGEGLLTVTDIMIHTENPEELASVIVGR